MRPTISWFAFPLLVLAMANPGSPVEQSFSSTFQVKSSGTAAGRDTAVLQKMDSLSGPGYTFLFDRTGLAAAKNYMKVFKESENEVIRFFGAGYRHPFRIRMFPDRASLDRQWQQDWKMPAFKSECWMVASGVASGLDLLSPSCWKTEACEHKAEDTAAFLKIITHEMVHVFHGQFNASPDFSAVTGIDWLVEGLAVYASGQMDSVRISQVKTVAQEGKLPVMLDDYWTGPVRYALAGSLVMYLDLHYGRQLLKDLLPCSTRREVLDRIGLSETTLIKANSDYWTSFK